MNDLEGLLLKLFLTYPGQAEEFERYAVEHRGEDSREVFYSYWEPVNPVLVNAIREAHKCSLAGSC